MAARFSSPAVGAWPITLGTRHQIHAFESQAVAEVPRTAEGGSRVPWSTPRWGMLICLLKPIPSYHLYTCTDNLALDTDNLALDGRDLKCLHGQMGSGQPGADGAILYRREWNG